ncbi:MAG: HU family DNA-binding protein, partial [Lachnospiraceae bacterium]|nr:HU family DNA-binding protein [Lachnospiraceae bacterium]
MNKNELIAAVAESAGISKKDAKAAVDATFEAIAAEMAKGGKLQLV